MKHFNFLKPLLMALMLVGGVNCAWAQVSVPDPVYFKDFSSTTGLTQVGSGEFVTDADNRFGAIYHNNPAKNTDARTNYLKLPEDVLTHSGTTNEMTIGFWVHVKDAGSDYFHCPVFSAYASSTPGQNNDSPMFRCSAKGVMQLNNGDGHWTDFTKEENDDEGKKTSGNTESTVYLDDENWHYYTVTLTSTKGIIYVDGNVVNSWTIKSDDITPAFFSSAATGGYPVVCLGGNQSWDWNDWDASFGYDDFAVYDKALSAEEIAQIITNKIHYTVNAVDESSNVLKILADANSRVKSVSYAYPRYINVNGTLYTKAAGSGINHYQESLTLTSRNQVKNVTYTATSYTGVLYFNEAEDVLSSTSSGGAGSRCSDMAGGYASSATKITTLPAGTYNIYFGAYASNRTHLYFYKNSESGGIIKDYTGSGSWEETNTGEFTLDEATDILVKGGTSGGYVFDYFIITGETTYTVIGASDCSTDYLVEMSDKVTLAPGQSWHYKFVNHNMGSTAEMAQNWVLPIYASDGTTKKIVIRSDNWEDVKWANTGFGWTTSSGNWYDDFVTEMDNATVDMTVNYSSTNVLTMTATITTKTGRTLNYTYNSSIAEVSLSDNIKIAISVSHSWLELIESWPSATIGSTGWTTFASAYPLDLSNMTASTGDVTAYYASSIGDGYVRMIPIESEGVAPGEGIMLKGTAGATITIPVVASGEDIDGNLLVGCTEPTELGTNSSYYVLVNNNGTAEFQSLAEHSANIPAGKAYLNTGGIGVKALSIVFDDITTGIASIENAEKKMDNAVFNLAGQRVSQPTRGLYIVNGKKVVIK